MRGNEKKFRNFIHQKNKHKKIRGSDFFGGKGWKIFEEGRVVNHEFFLQILSSTFELEQALMNMDVSCFYYKNIKIV